MLDHLRPVFVLLLVAYCVVVSGFESGPPLSVCSSLKPGHGPDFQKGHGPYRLEVGVAGKSGRLTVKLSSTGDPMRGFMVQARSSSGGQVVGSFAPSTHRAMDCGGAKGSTVSHKNSTPEKYVELEWIPQGNAIPTSRVVFKATVVKDFSQFYALETTFSPSP